MNINSTKMLLAMAVAALATEAACGDLTVHGCRIDNSSNSLYSLQAHLIIPTECPVSLGIIHESKYLGAYVTDPNAVMQYGQLLITNASETLVGQTLAPYQSDLFNGWSATIEIAYPTATGYQGYPPPAGTPLTGDANDYGLFESGPEFANWIAYAEIAVNYKMGLARLALEGPDLPLTNATATWTGDASAGSPPYSYAWYRNGQLVGSSQTYTASVGSTSFGLRLEVTDQAWSTSTRDVYVDVDGVRGTLIGPGQVDYGQVGVWTVSARGGYAPYSIHWYYENALGTTTDLGTAASYTGYPGQGTGTLLIEIQDSHGRTDTAALQVVGRAEGTCQNPRDCPGSAEM